MKADAYEVENKTIADNEAHIIKIDAKTRLAVAKNKSRGYTIEVQAENKHQNNMEGVRRFDEKMKLQDSLMDLGSDSKMIISGEQGKNLLGFYSNTISEVSNR